ncbi:hypothetical protein BLNAU_17138 [Blattamonas nauphoetae]|uniref:Transposase n=1 Tax=Blattamonas nauphoetae TaxID=2049346 RepID=A0ABQ9X7N2_9EUKA|nr:hypothetical protein BLNAU_17138 [Blattamonas nauphoetae]
MNPERLKTQPLSEREIRIIQRTYKQTKSLRKTSRATTFAIGTIQKYRNVGKKPAAKSKKPRMKREMFGNRELKKAKRYIEKNTVRSLAELKPHVSKKGSLRSFQRFCAKNDIKLLLPTKKLPINSITKKKRKDWATTLLRGTQTGKDFVFDDEVSFGLTGPPIFYRKLVHGKQAKNIRKNVDRKGTVGFWGMIGYGYKSQFIRVRETLNAERYAKMLSTEWKRANLSQRNPPVSLVTDNALTMGRHVL